MGGPWGVGGFREPLPHLWLHLPPPSDYALGSGATLPKPWRWNKDAHRGPRGHWRSAPRPSPGRRRRSVCLTVSVVATGIGAVPEIGPLPQTPRGCGAWKDTEWFEGMLGAGCLDLNSFHSTMPSCGTGASCSTILRLRFLVSGMRMEQYLPQRAVARSQ